MSFTGLRSMVDRFLTDTCVISTPVEPVYDPDTGDYPDVTGTIVYDGKCRVRPSAGPRVVNAGEDTVSLHTYDVWLPWDTTGVEIDQLVTVTSDDPHLTTRVLRVIDVQGGSETPHRKLVCEDTLTVSEEGS